MITKKYIVSSSAPHLGVGTLLVITLKLSSPEQTIEDLTDVTSDGYQYVVDTDGNRVFYYDAMDVSEIV